ncbi:hypothetical protein [Methylibium sp.]|uniref:hypothetical protein n=1 Tax=Methylibium sp. TaxID=2067992 RepID=UPI0025F87EB0|nr:hypothetical protein [Methylibium sp.]
MPKWSGTIYEVLSAPISPLEIVVGSSRRSPSWAAGFYSIDMLPPHRVPAQGLSLQS